MEDLLEYLNYWNIDSEGDSLDSVIIPDAKSQPIFDRLVASKNNSQDSVNHFSVALVLNFLEKLSHI